MEINQKDLEHLRGMSDAALSVAAESVAQALGLGETQTRRLVQNPEKVRNLLGEITAQDLTKMLQQLPSEQLEAFVQALRNTQQ